MALTQRQESTISGKTQAEVTQKLREVTAEIGKGVFKEACKLTVGEWMDIWSTDYLVNVKPRTLESYCCQIAKHVIFDGTIW